MTIDRYHRQALLPQIGPAGQKKLTESRVLLVGCGALGSTIAELLARAGVGMIRIADRDIVELTNLQRQVLFDEADAREGLPKAVAAARRLAKVNSAIVIEPRVVDVDAENIEQLVAGIDLILDGTDNVVTRFLINDVSVKLGVVWIYGACVGAEGRTMTIRPGQGPCLRCIFPQPPDPRDLPTCDTAGVLGPVAAIVGALQALSAIKLLSGNETAVAEELSTFDLWTNYFRVVATVGAKRADCLTCGQHHYEFLEARPRDGGAKLCGRNAVQIRLAGAGLSLNEAAQRLRTAGPTQVAPFMVRCNLTEGGLSVTVFEDSRVLVQGTSDPARAKSVVARYFGS